MKLLFKTSSISWPQFLPLSSKYFPQHPVLKYSQSIISVGFWRWCICIKLNVFMYFIHRPVSQDQTN